MSVNVDLMKVYIIPSKSEIMVNVGKSVNNWIIGFFVKIIICGILVHVNLSVIRHVKLTNI